MIQGALYFALFCYLLNIFYFGKCGGDINGEDNLDGVGKDIVDGLSLISHKYCIDLSTDEVSYFINATRNAILYFSIPIRDPLYRKRYHQNRWDH